MLVQSFQLIIIAPGLGQSVKFCKCWISIARHIIHQSFIKILPLVDEDRSIYGPQEEQLLLSQQLQGTLIKCLVLWKSRFQCLGNTLCFQPRRCCIVIIATAVLHNYLKQHGCPDPSVEYEDDPDVPMVEADNDRHGSSVSSTKATFQYFVLIVCCFLHYQPRTFLCYYIQLEITFGYQSGGN